MLDQQVDDLSEGRTDDHAGCRIDHVTFEGEFILLVLECPLEHVPGGLSLVGNRMSRLSSIRPVTLSPLALAPRRELPWKNHWVAWSSSWPLTTPSQ